LRGENLQCEVADSDTQSPRSFARLGRQVSRKDAKYAKVSIQEIHFAQRRQGAKDYIEQRDSSVPV
jgi:hypothetical protein